MSAPSTFTFDPQQRQAYHALRDEQLSRAHERRQDYATQGQKRTCRICKAKMVLTRNNLMRRHNDSSGQHCVGSGEYYPDDDSDEINFEEAAELLNSLR